MIPVITVKLLAGAVLLTATSMVGVAISITRPEWLGFEQDMFIYGISEVVSSGEDDEIVLDGSNKNYKCKFTSSTEFDCTITDVELDDEKKHTPHSQFSTGQTTTNITKSELVKANNIYKITAAYEHTKDWNNDTNKDKKLEIVKQGENSKKYASIKTLFSVQGSKTEGKIGYFIGKSFNEEVKTEAGKTYKCYFKTSDKEKKECKIYDFSTAETDHNNSSGFDGLTFQKTLTAESTAITQYKHYIIKFTKPEEFLNFSASQGNEMIYAEINSSDKETKIAEFKNIKPTIYDGTENLLILK